MGTIHKFNRPPKNEKQFRGYRPDPAARKPARRRLPERWRSAAAWLALIALAVALWAAGKALG